MSSRGPLRAALLAVALASSGCAWRAAARGGNAAAPGHVEEYRVEIVPDLERQSIAGSTTLRMTLADGVRSLRIPVDGVTVDGVRVGRDPAPFTHRDGVLTVALGARTAGARAAEVTVAYHGSPPKALVWGARSVHTTFFSCGWMICEQDRPGDRSQLVLDLVVPEDVDVVASGQEVARTAAGDGRTRHTWRQDRPYPNYLFGFAVGRFERVSLASGPAGLDVVAEGTAPERLRALFRDTEGMRAFFEEKAGVPLPARYTQVLVDGTEAQEASSLSFVGRTFVEPILSDPHEDWVIAHELAHQWWGNLVTCASWQHFWLNEGITTFMVAAYKEQRWGRADYDREMELARGGRQRAIDAGADHPLAYAGEYPSPRIKRAIAYSKGALFVDLLRRTLGEAAFWEGLRRYTQAYAGRSVESRDFQRAMEAASGKDLGELFAQWVYGHR